MANYESTFENFNILLKKLMQKPRENLRFSRSFVIASDIAEQFYCEKKVELEYLHGEIETEAKNIGAEAHENLTEVSVKVKRADLWKKIYGVKPVFALEMFLLAEYNGILLAGKPDSVLFARGFPLVVFEYKFSKSDVDYLSYHVQTETYGLLLGNMGFDTRRLFYAIVVADPKTKGRQELKNQVIKKVFSNPPKETVYVIDDAKVYMKKFNRATAEEHLTWALEFWNRSRAAQPTGNLKKCGRCEYQEKCQEIE